MGTEETLDVVARDAAEAFGDAFVERGAQAVRINLDDAALTIILRAEAPNELICRAYVAALTRVDDPGALCQAALEANYFWSGTQGAVLTVDADATALYLSDRLTPGQIAGAEALARYVRDFVETLVDWRLRVRSGQGGIDALPESADFSLPEDERAPSEAAMDIAAEQNGMEVFR